MAQNHAAVHSIQNYEAAVPLEQSGSAHGLQYVKAVVTMAQTRGSIQHTMHETAMLHSIQYVKQQCSWLKACGSTQHIVCMYMNTQHIIYEAAVPMAQSRWQYTAYNSSVHGTKHMHTSI